MPYRIEQCALNRRTPSGSITLIAGNRWTSRTKRSALTAIPLWPRGDGLAYLKEYCETGDTDVLHIIPTDPADLPTTSRERGFANLDFHFTDHGANIGGK